MNSTTDLFAVPLSDSAGRTHTATRYAVTSLPAEVASAERLMELVRGHWCIENELHYRRDVMLQEDVSLLCRGRRPAVLAALNNGVIGLVRQHGERTLAAVQRHFMRRFDQAINRLELQKSIE